MTAISTPSGIVRSLRPVQLALAISACLSVASVGVAQRDMSSVEMKAEHVAGKVHMITGAGGNIGVSAGDDGILFIDDQFAPLADKIRAAIKGIHAGDLEYLINTHFHGDHTGSNAIFGEDATIVAHENVRVRLSSPDNRGGAAPASALPVITFDDGLSIFFNGERVRVTHLPTGHTDGDSYIYFEDSKVAHLGDHFFVGRFPYVDVGNGGNAEGLRSNIEMLLKSLPAGTKIIPGHGPLADLGDLKEYFSMLNDTIGMVKQAKSAGKSLADVQKQGFGEKYKEWGSGFINSDAWTEIIFSSLN